MTNFVAKQIQKGVPIWDLLADGADIGSLTSFPGEGPMATVKFHGRKATYSAGSIHAVLGAAKEGYFDLIEEVCNDEFIEDEDGEMARWRHEENLADDWASREDDEPSW